MRYCGSGAHGVRLDSEPRPISPAGGPSDTLGGDTSQRRPARRPSDPYLASRAAPADQDRRRLTPECLVLIRARFRQGTLPVVIWLQLSICLSEHALGEYA